ncbi:phage stabilization protein [Caudoviricetes sp.]|nr:phage stabilization protein [Caudoviricetes sp.]
MANNLFKTQFSAGEISPSLYARVDSAVYQSGAKKIRNAFVRPHGSIVNRSGTEFIGQARTDQDYPQVRLIPFQFNENDSYVLVFSHKRMEVIRNSGYVLVNHHIGETADIASISKASICVVTTQQPHSFKAGDAIRISLVSGMTQITSTNSGLYLIRSVTSTTMTLYNPDGTPLDSTSFSTHTANTGLITGIPLRISNITKATECVMTTVTAHGLSDGDRFQINGVAGMSEVNGRTFIVGSHTPNTINVYDLDGFPLDSSNFTDYTVPASSNGTFADYFSKSMPYSGDELAQIRYDQSVDVMTLCHPDYTARFLTRQDHDVWRLDEATFEPTLSPPTDLTGRATHKVSVSIDGASRTNPIVLSLDNAQTSFSQGSCGFVRSVGGMVEINDRVFVLGDQTDATNKSYELENTSLAGVNGTSYSTYTSGGTFEGDTLYRYVVTSVSSDGSESRPSSAFLITSKAMSALTDAGTPYPKIMLEWSSIAGASSYNVYRQAEVPSGAPAVGGAFGYVGNTTSSQFTDQNISPDFTKQPPQGYNPFLDTVVPYSIEAIERTTNPKITTTTTNSLEVGDVVKFMDIQGMTQLNGYKGVVSEIVSTSQFRVVSYSDGSIPDTTSYGAFQANITAITQANPAVFTADHNYKVGDTVYISGVAGMVQVNGLVGIIRSVSGNTFTLKNATTGKVVNSTSYTTYSSGGVVRSYKGIVERRNPMNNPIATCYYQQRKVYGGSLENPASIWMTQSGDYDNMDKSPTIKDSDSIELKLSSWQIETIKHLVPLSALLVFTAGGCFKLSGGQNGAITPTDVQAVAQDATGANDVKPLVLGGDILYVGNNGKSVNSTAYTFVSDAFKADDIVIRATHLLDDHEIKEWASSLNPNKLAVAVRSDGKLLFLTYLKESQVIAWSWGDTGNNGVDAFESVCSLREGGEDFVYLVARRYIDGANGSAFRKYVERMHTRTLDVSESKGQTVYDPKSSVFLDSCVKYNGEYDESGASTNEVVNLHHLEGREVGIVVDGNVVKRQTVKDGKITLDKSGVVIVVGLPYVSEVVTLPIDTGNGSVSAKRKRIVNVTLRVDRTRGLEVSVDGNEYIKNREAVRMGQTQVTLFSGDVFYQMQPHHDRTGSVYIRQIDPLPFELLGVIPSLYVSES